MAKDDGQQVRFADDRDFAGDFIRNGGDPYEVSILLEQEHTPG